uniref:proline-rich protein 2-like n=1 Tax=Epinephelus lanceolatus TaxID=310571 RepID=UPI001448354C|nr:proline-rich protein 2-like [Epinephelus lanceolatus]
MAPQDRRSAQTPRPGHHAGPRTQGGNGRHPQRARDTPQMGGAGGPAHPPPDADRPPTPTHGCTQGPPPTQGARRGGPAPPLGREPALHRMGPHQAPATSRRWTGQGPRRATRPNPPGRAPTNTQERAVHHEQSIPHRDPLAEGPKTTAGQEAEPRQEPTEPPGRHPAHPPQGHGTPQTLGTQQHHHDHPWTAGQAGSKETQLAPTQPCPPSNCSVRPPQWSRPGPHRPQQIDPQQKDEAHHQGARATGPTQPPRTLMRRSTGQPATPPVPPQTATDPKPYPQPIRPAPHRRPHTNGQAHTAQHQNTPPRAAPSPHTRPPSLWHMLTG